MGDLRGSYALAHELVVFAAKGRHLLNGKRLSLEASGRTRTTRRLLGTFRLSKLQASRVTWCSIHSAVRGKRWLQQSDWAGNGSALRLTYHAMAVSLFQDCD